MHAIYNPASQATPSQHEAAIAHRARRDRIAAAAVPGQPEPARAVELDDIMPDKTAASVLAPIPNEAMRQAIKLLPDVNQFGVRLEVIIRAVLRHFPNITKLDLLSPRRDHAVCRPRQIVMYLARKMTTRSLPEIARQLGGRDHTTALSAIRKIESLRKTDARIDADVRAIIAALGGIVA